MKRMKLLFTIALPVILLQNAQAQMSRLIGKADWANNGTRFVPVDTTSYTYSHGQGGDLKHQMLFDNSETWVATDTSLNASTMVSQDIDTILHRLNSATTLTWNVFSGSWSNTSKIVYFYNGDGTVDRKINQTWGGSSWVNVSQDKYAYTGGMLNSDTYGTWNGVQFVNVSQKLYYYTGTMKIQELDQNLSGATPVFTGRYDYTYTATTNWLASTTWSTWNGSSFVASNTYTNTYDSASGNQLTQTYQTYDNTGAAVNVSLKSYTSWFGTSKMPTAEVDQNWDTASGGSYNNVKSWTYSYNSHNQLTQSVGESWNSGGFWEFAANDPMANYYYESYTPSTAVQNVNSMSADVNVYPNPAQNVINLNVNWKVAQEFSVTVFDMNGGVVSAITVPATTQYAGQINTDNFATGVYVIQIRNNSGVISKQVVVAH